LLRSGCRSFGIPVEPDWPSQPHEGFGHDSRIAACLPRAPYFSFDDAGGGCQFSQLDPDFVEKYKCRRKLCPVEDQDGKQYYHVFDFTDLKDMQESSRIFYQPKERAVSDTAIYIRGYVFRIVLEFPYKVNRHEKHFR